MNKNIYVASLVGLVFVGSYISENLTVSVSESISKRVFWQSNMNPEKNDYGTFYYPNNDYLEVHEVFDSFTKKVGCVSGEILSFKNGHFYCNDDYLATPLEKNQQGEALPVFRFNGEIPAYKAFMVGENPYSGDSRYMGLVDIRTVKKAIPLW